MQWHIFAMRLSFGILELNTFFWKIQLFPQLKAKISLLTATRTESTSYFPFFLWRGHLLRLRCSMIEHVSGQAWSSVTTANSSSYQLMEGSFGWLMPLKELSCIHLGWACCLGYLLETWFSALGAGALWLWDGCGHTLYYIFSCFVPQGYNNSKAVTLEASFTPDSQFIMIGKIIPLGKNFSALKLGVLHRT